LDDKIEFVRDLLRASHRNALPDSATAPTAFLDATIAHAELTRIGLRLLREGKIAVLMVAGGISTRMGNNCLRGNLPIGPVTGRSIFRLQGEKIAAIKKRYASRMLWLVMTSAAVHGETVRSFQREGYYGVSPEDVWFFQHASLPVLDANLNPIHLADGTYLQSPAGHGGMLDALGKSGLLNRLRQRGVEYLFYFQYPNVLERVCDPVMLGYHHVGGFEVTTKAFRGYRPDEKVGRVVAVGGSLRVVEYHPIQNAEANSWWHTVPANSGTHVWSVSFLERCLKEGIQLPYYSVYHRLSGDTELPLRKVEQFVFDLLPHARTSGLVVVSRAEEYAPIKLTSGDDSVEFARLALLRLYRNWLDRAGAIPKGVDCRIEVSPFYALDADDVFTKLPRGFCYQDGLVLK